MCCDSRRRENVDELGRTRQHYKSTSLTLRKMVHCQGKGEQQRQIKALGDGYLWSCSFLNVCFLQHAGIETRKETTL